MENTNLDFVLRKLYDIRVEIIKESNACSEREELSGKMSYDDIFNAYKNIVKDADEKDVEYCFQQMQNIYLFSYGHDYIFKNKLKADIFGTVPMEKLIYPMLSQDVKKKYSDEFVDLDNPNLKQNLKEISDIVFIYTEVQSLLFFLYNYDFLFPERWEELYKGTSDEIIRILNESGMKIGDFLNELVDYKCDYMIDVFGNISNSSLREKYLKKIEELKNEKKEIIKTFHHIDLPVTYFLNHTIGDFKEMVSQKGDQDDDYRRLNPNK